MRISALVFSILIAASASGQFVIGPGTQLGAAGSPLVLITTDQNVIDSSDLPFPEMDFRLTMIGETGQELKGSWSINQLTLASTGDLTMDGEMLINNLILNLSGDVLLDGNLTVTNAMIFNNGVLHPANESKILYTGPAANLQLPATNASYVNGTFFQSGTGRREFPVGDGSFYAPLILTDVKTAQEVSVRVINQDPNLSVGSAVVFRDDSRYWEVLAEDYSSLQSPVRVSVNGIADDFGKAFTVLQADATSSTAEILGTNEPDEITQMVSSQGNISKPIIAIGRTDDVDIKIHDLITPSAGSHDKLVIESLDAFESNRVILLDRWGVIVKEWRNYTNTNNEFDFKSLTPGNYICVVEYTASGERTRKKSQMITVIKTK